MEVRPRLAAALRVFGRFGFTPARIAARDPGGAGVWTNPSGVDLRRVRVADLVVVDDPHDDDDDVVGAVLAGRPDAVAVAHASTPNGLAWAATGRPLDPLTQDACAFYRDLACSVDELAAGPAKAALVPGHGIVTVGQSVDEAAWWLLTLERSCQVQLLARSAGVPVEIDPDVAAATYRATGGHATGERQFRPLWDWITALEPDLLADS